MQSYWQQQQLHMHRPILGDQQHILDNYQAHAKLLTAAAVAYAQAHPRELAAYLRSLVIAQLSHSWGNYNCTRQ